MFHAKRVYYRFLIIVPAKYTGYMLYQGISLKLWANRVIWWHQLVPQATHKASTHLLIIAALNKNGFKLQVNFWTFWLTSALLYNINAPGLRREQALDYGKWGILDPNCTGPLKTIDSEHNYSRTSNSGPSEIGTLYNKPLYKRHCLRSQKSCPIVLVHNF